MGFRLEPENVRYIAMELLKEGNPWDYGGADDIGYLKLSMYNIGVLEMTDAVIKAINELKKS